MRSGMEAPSEAEIASCLERATRSALESSCLSSYLFSQSSSARREGSPVSSLTDLLADLGPPDASRCPSCRAVLPFNSRSHICLACNTSLLEPVVPSFTSSIAFRQLAEALHLDDLETDDGEVDEQVSDSDMDLVNKMSLLSSPLPSAGDKQTVVAATSGSFGGENKDVEERTVGVALAASISFKTVNRDMQQQAGDGYSKAPSANTSTSMDSGFNITKNTPDHADFDKRQSNSILDYAAKLEGISLDDFFSSQAKGETPVVANSDMFWESLSGMVPSTAQVDSSSIRKNSLFFDPLTDSIIPNGFDFMEASTAGNTSIIEASAWDMASGAEDDDSSWEGEFQSAAPASSSFEPHSLGLPSTSAHLEDMFGSFSTKQESSSACSTMQQENVGWPDSGHPSLGVHTNTENTHDLFAFSPAGALKDSTERSMDDMLFGLGWQQTEPSSLLSAPTESFSDEQSSRCGLSEELGSSYQIAIHTSNNTSFHSEEEASASAAGEKKKIVGSLLAQLHDLSFMLADKLVIRTEGKQILRSNHLLEKGSCHHTHDFPILLRSHHGREGRKQGTRDNK